MSYSFIEDLKARIEQSARARICIQKMKKDKPLPQKQVYGDKDKDCRDRIRYHRNLYRYKLFYTKTRIPILDPKLEDL